MRRLSKAVETIGKSRWRALLKYVADLHAASTHPPRYPFPFPWEEIGPGYCYGPAFGHWDLVHAILDVILHEPEHARNQILNNLAAQQADGLVPGSIWMRDDPPRWNQKAGHPPVWPVAVEEYTAHTGSDDLIAACYENLVRQIGWFEKFRQAEPVGFFYTDILNHTWESGIDEGIRFDDVLTGPFACVDATSHVYALYVYAARWSELLGKDPAEFEDKAAVLRHFIQNQLFGEDTGLFHDVWAVSNPAKRRLAHEGMWPLVVGAATEDQAQRVIEDNLLNPQRFFAQHPISTVAQDDPLFELRMWRGPTWNSMTYWAACGCVRYDRKDAARRLLEKALDGSAVQFERTGTIWEFYHPHGGRPKELQRKPHTPYNVPCRDYLGHNPLIAMARLYDAIVKEN
jgi:glycogen debranching enzyme